MHNTNRLGPNICALRVAYNETQEQLAQVIHVETKSAVSNYENNKREPDKDTLKRIAAHYMVSVDELMNEDLTAMGKITIDKNAFWKNLPIILPIVSSEKALKNQHFKKAFDAHKSFYDSPHRVSREENGEIIDKCMTDYLDAAEDTTINAEALANWLALFFILELSMQAQALFMSKPTALPAAFKQLASRDEKFRKIVNNHEADANTMLNETDIAEKEELMSEMLTIVKHSKDWSDLAYYYLALRYVWNLVDNNMDWGFNARIGREMMNALISVNNRYAVRCLQVCHDALFRASSQIVDDR